MAIEKDFRNRIKTSGIRSIYESSKPLEIDLDNQVDFEDYLK